MSFRSDDLSQSFDLLGLGGEATPPPQDHSSFTGTSPEYNSQSSIDHETSVSSPSRWETFSRVNENLLLSAKEHRNALDHKKTLDKKTQSGHASLWTFPTQERSIEGYCGCNVPAVYTYTFRVATFNQSLYERLKEDFGELHEHNVGEVFMTLFEQTVSELQLSRLIHSQIPRLSTMSKVDAFRETRDRLDALFELLASAREFSSQAQDLLQALVIFLGSFMVSPPGEQAEPSQSAASDRAPPASPLLDLLGNESAPSSPSLDTSSPHSFRGARSPEDEISCYFVAKLSSVGGLTWGQGLLQYSVEQVEKYHLLQAAVSEVVQAADSPASDFIALFSQFPWQQLGSFSSIKAVQKELLAPVRQCIDYAAEKHYFDVLLMLGNVLLACSYEYEEAVFECISAITAGKWPMKMVCSRLLQRAPLFKLKKEYLVALFGHLYNLHNQPPLEFASLTETERHPHRRAFVEYLVRFPVPVEIMDNKEDPAQYQPVLPLIYQFASHASSGSQFQRMIVRELFYFAFVESVVECANSDLELHLLQRFRSEAAYCLRLLVERNPSLMGTIIFCIGQNLHLITVKSLIDFMKPSVFARWSSVDLYSANWIAHFFAQWKFPPGNDTELKGNSQLFQYLLDNALQPPRDSPECSPSMVTRGIEVGQAILRSINWSLVEPSIRLYFALIIIKARHHMPAWWALDQLSSSLGRKLLAPPLDEMCIQAVLNVNPETFPDALAEAYLLQLLVALNIVSEQNRNSRSSSSSDESGHQWLLNFNFYRRAVDFLSRTNAAIAADLFIQMDILRDSPASYPHLASLVQQICNADRPAREEIPKVLASALYQSLLINTRDPANTREDNEKRVRLWMSSAFPEGRQDKGKFAMINSLIAFAYCNGYSLDSTVSTFRSKNYTRNDIVNMSNDGFPWCALAALYTFQPVLPSGARDRNCALVLLQDIAQNEGTSAAAVALWLHYFMIYFSANPHGANEVVPKATQDNLSRHFITTAKSFETSNQEIYRLYYAFSTWKKAIVDSATGDFHEEQNIDLMDAVIKELPEYLIQGKTSIRVNGYDKIEALIPFRPLATPETEDAVLSSLPKHMSVPEQKLPSNMDQYSALEQGIESALQFLRDLNNNVSSPTEQIEIPLVSHLLVLLENYSRTSQTLARLDEQFLELTKQSYYNFQKAFQVRAPCQKEGSCVEPARLEGQTVSIEPAYPNAIIDIQANRTEYGREYGNLFDVARALAQISVLLRNSLEMICHSNAPLSPECAVAIFFTVVKKIILTNLIPSGTPIASQVIESLLFIGRRYIQNRPEFQLNLFKVLLATPSNVVAPRRQRSVSTMSSASRSAIQFVGSSETNETTNAIQQKIPADLYSLFTPQIFVQQGDVRQYLDLLETVVQQTGKSEEELRELSKCFEGSSFLPLLESQLTEELVERLLSIVPILLSKPSFAPLGSTYVSFLVRKGHQHRTLSLLFSPSVPGAYASQMVEKLQMDTAQLDTVISILQSLHSRLPLAEQHIDVATTLLEMTTAQSPAFQQAFKQENPAGYDSEGKPITSRLWNIVYEFYSERGIINERSHVTDRQLARFLNVLYAIVEPSGANIIDKVWYLFSHSLLPALGRRLRNKECPLTEEILWTMANSLPWRQTRFLLYDPDSLSVLNKHLHNVSNFICGIFKQLDWDTFTSRLARSNQSKLISTLGLALLQLVLRINLIEPNSIPTELFNRLVPSEEPTSEQDIRIDWRLVDGPLFASTFNGEVLISPIREGLIQRDPSQQLLSNCEILKTVALQVEKPQAILGCIREASSLMLYAIKVGQGLYWYLPLASQLQLLSSMIIPLTHQTTGDETSSCEMTLHVLSCILCQNWSRVENIDLPFHNATIYPNGFTQDPAFTDFATRVKGLVIQFCGASTPALALRIIKTVPMIDVEGSPHQGMTPDLWLEITENTLRTYFASTEEPNPLRKVSSVAKIPHHDRLVLLQHAQNSKPLSLLLLLDHWRAEVEQQGESTQWPSELFEYSTHFLPGEHRSFNAVPLWFFILQLVQSPRFDPVQCQQDAMKFLSYFKSLFEKSAPLDAPIFLAAKAVELFFFRIIRRRTMGGGDKGNKALMDMFERFRKLRNQSSYKDYQQFFEATEQIMDPLYTTESLQHDILSYLFPTAQPLLQPLLSSSF